MSSGSVALSRALTRSLRSSALRGTRAAIAVPSSARLSSSDSTIAESSATWSPAIAPGTLPAYDEALAFLSSEGEALRREAAQVGSTPSTSSLTAAEQEILRESLIVASEINDPAILHRFSSQDPGTYDASSPTFRHLRERLWRKSGILERVMQRVQSMFVMPDVLPAITPTVDLQVAFGTGPGFTDQQSDGGDVLVGCKVSPQHTIGMPSVRITAFHMNPKKYTLLLVDPDSPSSETESFKIKVHALKSGITVSATTASAVDLQSDMEVKYVPPHPQAGTDYHRYTMIAFEEPEASSAATPLTEAQQDDFNVAAFVQERQLTPAGIHFWRSEWTKECADSVSHIYREILGTPEPRYTRPPRPDLIRKSLGQIGSKWY